MNFRAVLVLTAVSLLSAHSANAQSFGVELLNNVMPASGGMAGASIALPQDLQSAINGNPATLTQYRGTQFSFGSAWIEPTYNLTVAAPGLPLIGVSPFFDAKSDAQGVAAGNIGVTQDFSAWGLPATTGVGLMAGSGAGVDFRHIPESNGTHANIIALDIVAAVGLDLTERLSAGASLALTNATLDGPFVGISGSSTDFGLRGRIGINYQLFPSTSVGGYWSTKTGYTFENLAGFTPGNYFDVAVDRPQVFGIGISNRSLWGGRLLIACDAVNQQYTNTALFGEIFEDQWALQFGTQFSASDRMKLRMGYAWNDNPMRESFGDEIGGIVPPGGGNHVRYIQALFAAIPQHRITGGLSVRDVLPGVDLDLFAGGTFQASQTFGLTTATVQSYWLGTGITWRFGGHACGEDGCTSECAGCTW